MNFFMENKTMPSGDMSSPWTGFDFRHFLLGMIALMTSARVAVADPGMYLNRAEIDAIQLKVDAGEAPWTDAYAQVMAATNTALSQPLLSVTFQGDTGNQYSTQAPFCGWTAVDGQSPDCRDGEINLAQDRGDYDVAIQVGDTVRDLGLAYAFTGQSQYADKAIDMIRAWSLDSTTRMLPISSPKAISNAGGRIEIFITMPGYLYGADLISDYEGWDPVEKAGFQDWTRALADHTIANGTGANNFSNWRVVLAASAGALLDDQAMLDFAEDEWKSLIRSQMKGVGSNVAGALSQEVGRAQGLHYSLFALNAMIQGAEILNTRGVDVYDYVGPADLGGGAASLKLALDYIVGFASAEDPVAAFEAARGLVDNGFLGYTQITPITADNSMALFELAYSYWQDPDYLAVLERWGRPIDDIRPMGNVTLTHGNTFELSAVPGLAGDFDSDGDVDGADFLRWQRDGLSSTDLDDWQANFGTLPPEAVSTSVPEPSTGLMMVCCGVCAMRCRRHAAA